MPSYTFNSNTTLGRHPRRFSLGVFLLWIMIFFGVFGGGLEWFWRSGGHFPTVSDTASLWGTHMDRIPEHASDAVVIVGSSRFQMGLDPAVIQKELGAASVLHLARAGSSPLPVLDYLVRETEFSGLVFVDIMPPILFNAESGAEVDVAAALAMWKQRPFYTPVEESLLSRVQALACLNNPGLSWKLFGNGFVSGNWPKPAYGVFRPDRFIQSDFERSPDLKKLQAGFIGDPDSWAGIHRMDIDELVGKLSELSARLAARGGRAVLVRMPSSGELFALEEKTFPKEDYWDAIKLRFGNDAVHFTEIEKASGRVFVCPDYSHLDYRDAAIFSAELCRLIQ